MMRSDLGRTDRSLLGRSADWGDSSACGRFDATYRPMVRAWGRRLGFGGDDLEELCQVVMIDLLGKMKAFRYDPLKSFRGWLRTIVQWRAVELVRARRRAAGPLIDPGFVIDDRLRSDLDTTLRPEDGPIRALADEVQLAVKRRVAPENWRIFWMIRVEGRPIAEVALAVGKTYAATYRNQERIARMLRDEADRRRNP